MEIHSGWEQKWQTNLVTLRAAIDDHDIVWLLVKNGEQAVCKEWGRF